MTKTATCIIVRDDTGAVCGEEESSWTHQPAAHFSAEGGLSNCKPGPYAVSGCILHVFVPQPTPAIPTTLDLSSSLKRPVNFAVAGPDSYLTITNQKAPATASWARPQYSQVRTFTKAQAIELRDFLNANFPADVS